MAWWEALFAGTRSQKKIGPCHVPRPITDPHTAQDQRSYAAQAAAQQFNPLRMIRCPHKSGPKVLRFASPMQSSLFGLCCGWLRAKVSGKRLLGRRCVQAARRARLHHKPQLVGHVA